MSQPVKHTVRESESWTLRQPGHAPKVVRKATVRVAKGAVGGNRPGTFHGATNLRGTVTG